MIIIQSKKNVIDEDNDQNDKHDEEKLTWHLLISIQQYWLQ